MKNIFLIILNLKKLNEPNDKLGRAIQVTVPFDTRNAISKTYYDKNSNVIKKSV